MAGGKSKKRVLWVCLGNICRSPLAEAVFRELVARRGLAGAVETDSAGTGDWHVGCPPDPNGQACASRHGLDISDLRARQLSRRDFERFDLIVVMDRYAPHRAPGPPTLHCARQNPLLMRVPSAYPSQEERGGRKAAAAVCSVGAGAPAPVLLVPGRFPAFRRPRLLLCSRCLSVPAAASWFTPEWPLTARLVGSAPIVAPSLPLPSPYARRHRH